MECLNNIIGLSRKDCECFTDDRPANWNESKSGLYLDELPGLTQKNVSSSTDCGEGSIWDILQRSLENGESKFRTDILSSLRQRFKEAFPPFNGSIGLRKFNGSAPQIKNLMGLRIESNCIKGSCLIVKSIDAYFDTDIPSLDVEVYELGNETPIQTITISATAYTKTTTELATALELPMYKDGQDELSYMFVYNLPVGVKPLNTRLYTCTCKRKSNAWSIWATVDGITQDAFTDTQTLHDLGGTSYTYGLNLGAQFQCKKGAIICEDDQDFDFENDDIALQIAHAIREAAGIFVLEEILERPDSAYFALNEEQIQTNIAKWSINYQDRIEYLALNINPKNDCFTCGDQIAGVGILA